MHHLKIFRLIAALCVLVALLGFVPAAPEPAIDSRAVHVQLRRPGCPTSSPSSSA